MKQTLRVFIITQEEPFYLPVFFAHVLPQLKEKIVGVTILKENTSRFVTARKYFNFYGCRLFLIQSAKYVFYHAHNALGRYFPRKTYHSIRQLCALYKLPIIETKNINSDAFMNAVKDVKANIIASVACPQIFAKRLIRLPSFGCINVHGAPLPKYRGMLPSFWMLLNNEKEGAVSVHYMSERIDGGDIILQKRYSIEPTDTHHSVMIKSKKIAAGALLEAITRIEQNQVSCIPNDASRATYYSFPSRADVRQLRKKSRRLI